MSGISFAHPAISTTLSLPYAPVEVDWTYNLNTAETPTYAGQVVQILSVNFENVIFEGQFGSRSGRQEYDLKNGAWVRKDSPSLRFGKFGPSLTQMTEWFKEYFAIASQGIADGDNYNQQPVTVVYQGTYAFPVDDDKVESVWKVYPTSFPSYKIANDNFAPVWRVECQVWEAPQTIVSTLKDLAIIDEGNLPGTSIYHPLYQPGSKWSDPFPELDGPNATPAQLRQAAQRAIDSTLGAADFFMQNLPAYSPADVEELITKGFSSPIINSSTSSSSTTSQQQSPVPGTSLLPKPGKPSIQ